MSAKRKRSGKRLSDEETFARSRSWPDMPLRNLDAWAAGGYANGRDASQEPWYKKYAAKEIARREREGGYWSDDGMTWIKEPLRRHDRRVPAQSHARTHHAQNHQRGLFDEISDFFGSIFS